MGTRFSLILLIPALILLTFLPVTVLSDQPGTNKPFSVLENFITRSGDKLMDGSEEFRFISFNIPNLHILEDPDWHLPDPWEQEDAIKSIVQIGGRVARTYVISVSGGIRNPKGSLAHVYRPGVFDEEVFRCLDKALELANRHGIRLIIPLVDQWNWFGGINQYARFRRKYNFWYNQQVMEDFKQTINYVVNRTNYYTGVKYKDDKAIMAWETGNELKCPYSWTKEIAAYIKSLDPNHLVIDGSNDINPNSISDHNIDIISMHLYDGDFTARCNDGRIITKGKKPLLIGEFGLVETPVIEELLKTVINNGTAGALIWSLRYHNKDGGFYWHTDGKYSAYHWPGFSENSISDEINIMKLMRAYAYKIRKLPVPPLDLPEAPLLFPIQPGAAISWRGSTGAGSYLIERAIGLNGPWQVIKDNISDAKKSGPPFYIDKTATSEKAYYYRVKAKNEAGISLTSNVEKFVLMENE